MNREEAIEILKRIEYYDRPFDNSVESSMNSCQTREALAMAINALEQESMEKKVIKMRDATLEERKSVDEYIKSISTTGVNSWNLEPCEHAISREDAILQIQKHQICSCDPEECYPEQCERNVISWLSNLPSVTPSRKKGKWIGHGEHCENLGVIPSGLGAYEWCSNCDCGIDVREWHRNHYNYCPNCGAEMEMEE